MELLASFQHKCSIWMQYCMTKIWTTGAAMMPSFSAAMPSFSFNSFYPVLGQADKAQTDTITTDANTWSRANLYQPHHNSVCEIKRLITIEWVRCLIQWVGSNSWEVSTYLPIHALQYRRALMLTCLGLPCFRSTMHYIAPLFSFHHATLHSSCIQDRVPGHSPALS